MTGRYPKRRRTFPPPTLDPFERLFDVHHLIYQHLQASDMLTASEVAKKWNSNIGHSPICMQRIYLVFEPKNINNPPPAVVEMILKSHRQYKHLGFNCHYPGLDVLAKFSGSVEALNLQSIGFEIPMGSVEFPKLKVLDIGEDIPSRVVDAIFNGIHHGDLEKFGFQCEITETIMNYFAMHENIRELTLNKQLRSMFENSKIELMNRLKLKKIFLMNNFFLSFDGNRTNFTRFMNSQKNSVEHITLNMNRLEMVKTALEFPKLKILELPYLLSLDVTRLPVNRSVQGAFFFLRLADAESMLSKLPNLKVLQWSFYDEYEENLEMITRVCTKLKKIYFAIDENELSAFEVIDAYEEMKDNEDLNINRDIELIHVDTKFKLNLKMLDG